MMERKNYKNVIFYTEAFPPNRGGGENYSVDFAQTLTLLGYSLQVITPIHSEEDELFPFKVLRIRKPVFLRGFNFNLLELIKTLLENRTSIMHISGPTAIDSILIIFCKIMRIPVVVTFHGQFNSKLGKLILKITGKIFYPLSDRVIVQSNRDIDFLSTINQNTKSKLLYFNGVNRDKYQCDSSASNIKLNSVEQFKFIFIGGISSSRPYKGIENLIRIFKKLFDEHKYKNVYLTIIGDGDLLPMIRSQTKNYTNILFLGNMSDTKLVNELCKSDALILPSISNGEGFGRVALEAISCKKLVLVSKYAGISELIEKYNAGLIFDPNDISGSVERINFILNHRSFLIDYINNAEDMILYEELDLVSSTKKTVEIYENILNKRKSKYE